jgi:hypothetical protein
MSSLAIFDGMRFGCLYMYAHHCALQVMSSTDSSYSINWPDKIRAFLNACRFGLFEFLQITSMDCWVTLNFFDTYTITVTVTLGFVALTILSHFGTPFLFHRCCPEHWAEWGQKLQQITEKGAIVFMSIVYPSVSQKALSLWNCETIGATRFLVSDLRIVCEGSFYRGLSGFNVFFVLAVVCGWPTFLVWRLWSIHKEGRATHEAVVNSMGFLYQQYLPDYYLYDVLETLRKLYLVALVSFFARGSILQIVCSIIVSFFACLYHWHAKPYRDRWLNCTQCVCCCAVVVAVVFLLLWADTFSMFAHDFNSFVSSV